MQPAEPQGLPVCRFVASVPTLLRVEDRDTGCFEDSVLKILFRKHRGNFSSPFPFPGIVDPMKTLTPLLLVTKRLADRSPLTAGGYRVLPPGAPEVGADLVTLQWQPSIRAPGPCWQGLEDLRSGPGTSPCLHPCPVVL